MENSLFASIHIDEAYLKSFSIDKCIILGPLQEKMPPKKQAGKKTSLKDKKKQEEQLKISRTLKELLKNYVLKCGKDQSICYPPFQDQILRCKDEGNYLARV